VFAQKISRGTGRGRSVKSTSVKGGSKYLQSAQQRRRADQLIGLASCPDRELSITLGALAQGWKLKVRDEEGRELDAAFTLEPTESGIDLVMASR
jgi:hypothetical protein